MKGFNRTLAAFVLAFLTAGAAGALDAKVISVSGKVEVQKNGSATWTPLKTGDSLSKGSVIHRIQVQRENPDRRFHCDPGASYPHDD